MMMVSAIVYGGSGVADGRYNKRALCATKASQEGRNYTYYENEKTIIQTRASAQHRNSNR